MQEKLASEATATRSEFEEKARQLQNNLEHVRAEKDLHAQTVARLTQENSAMTQERAAQNSLVVRLDLYSCSPVVCRGTGFLTLLGGVR